jgi:NADPH:quinone reductase-like Zn-dependent oxidoreductase
MRAVVQDRYGPVEDLVVREVTFPTVADDEVLVQVHAASVHPDVWHVVTGRPHVLRVMGSGLRRPRQRVPGTDVAGVVTAVGRRVELFQQGDEVFGETLRGLQWRNGGAYAEYAAVPEQNLALKPDSLSFDKAACLPTAGLIALNNLPTGSRLRQGSRVLVNGAGGGVGSIAVQLAKAAGASVTAVDDASKLELLRYLGAEHVIDYREQDFAEGGVRYDVVFDVIGNHTFAQCRRALTRDGTYVWIGHDGFGRSAGKRWGSLPRAVGLMARSAVSKNLEAHFKLPSKSESMARLCGLVEAGQLTVVVAATYPLERVVEAIHHLERGTAVGRIVLTV